MDKMMKLNTKGYKVLSRKITKSKKQWLEHRWVWTQANGEIPPKMQVHHINGIKTDNRIENLALVTQAQNMQKPDRMGKGYYAIKANKGYDKILYKAVRRMFCGKQKYIGYYGTPCGAYMASRIAFITI